MGSTLHSLASPSEGPTPGAGWAWLLRRHDGAGVEVVDADGHDGVAVADGAVVEGAVVEGAAVEGAAVEGKAVEGEAVEGAAVEGQERRWEHWGWVRQFLKFITVGLLNTAVELIIYNICLAIHSTVHPATLTLYSTLGVGGAILNSYVWNSRWAFREARARSGVSAMKQRVLFVIQALVNIGINDAVTVVLTPALVGTHIMPAVVSQNLAKVVAMMTSSFSSYAMLRLLVFV